MNTGENDWGNPSKIILSSRSSSWYFGISYWIDFNCESWNLCCGYGWIVSSTVSCLRVGLWVSAHPFIAFLIENFLMWSFIGSFFVKIAKVWKFSENQQKKIKGWSLQNSFKMVDYEYVSCNLPSKLRVSYFILEKNSREIVNTMLSKIYFYRFLIMNFTKT